MATANKQVVCNVLMELAKEDKDIVVLCSDSRGSGSMTPFADALPEQFIEVGIAEQSLVSVLSLFTAQPALCRSALRLLLRLAKERDPRFVQPSHHESFYSAVETLIKQEWVASDLEMLRELVQICLLADVNRNLDFCNKIVPFFLKVRRTARDPTLFILYVDAVIDLLLRLAFCAFLSLLTTDR